MFVALGTAVLSPLANLALGSKGGPLPLGIGLIIAGVLLYFGGRWFQNWDAERRVAKVMTVRKAEVQAAVASGNFQPTPGYQPSSPEEAQRLADQMLESERAAGVKKLRNFHTIFFIPMHFFGFVVSALGIVFAVAAFAL